MVGTHELEKLLSAARPCGPRWCWSVTPISWPRCGPVAACSSSCAPSCRGRSGFPRCGGCVIAEERDASLALRSGHGNRLRNAVGWYRTHGRLHTGDPIAMAADAMQSYLADRPPAGTHC